MRRSSLKIYMDVLKVIQANPGIRLTHIMYKANVNCSVLTKYLEFLESKGYIEKFDLKQKTWAGKTKSDHRWNSKFYRTTESSRKVLELFTIIEDLMEEPKIVKPTI